MTSSVRTTRLQETLSPVVPLLRLEQHIYGRTGKTLLETAKERPVHGFNVSFRRSYPRSNFYLLTNLDKIHWNHRPGVSSHKVDGTEKRKEFFCLE